MTAAQEKPLNLAQLRTAALRAGTVKHKAYELWAMTRHGTEAATATWITYQAAIKAHDHLMARWLAAKHPAQQDTEK